MYALHRQRARVSAVLDWRPEWPFAVVVMVAWVAMFAGSDWLHTWALGRSLAAVPALTLNHSAHPAHKAPGAAVPLSLPVGVDGSIVALAEWGVMSVAMMLPVTLPGVAHVGLNSLRRRRQRAMVIYVAVYVGIWLGFGLVTIAGLTWLRHIGSLDNRVLLTSALAIAAGWQMTRCKRRALFACRRTRPLPPVGRRADAACAHFARLQGWRCVKSCWALMVVMAVVGHTSLLLMAAMTGLILMEELTLIGRRLLGPSAGVLAISAVLVSLVRWPS